MSKQKGETPVYVSYDYYRVFYYVAKYGSITRAAALLLNSQPNLTRALKVLEGELGCPLFVRNNRGMKLTPEGERLYARVSVAVENITAGEREIEDARSLECGTVYVAASEVALHCALLPVLKEYRARYPGIRLTISNHSTPQAIDAIKNGIADIAVVTTPTVPSAALCEKTVRSFREVAVCSENLGIPAGKKINFSELLGYPMISLGPNTKSFELYSRFFSERGLDYRPETEAATADQIIPMAQADLGVGFVPEEFIKGTPGIVVIETEEPLPEREIRVVKRAEQAMSVAARELERLIFAGAGHGA